MNKYEFNFNDGNIMNNNNDIKIQLFQQQNQLQKQLKSKRDMISAVKRSYYKNKQIAQEQMELINHLTEIQNSYYEKISIPLPLPDQKISLYHQYRHLIDDLDKSYKETEEDNELAFPFDEDITPNINQYSDLYNQLDEWLHSKETFIEEGDLQQKSLKQKIEELKDQNLQLKNLIEKEPDISEQIIEIKKKIKAKKSLLSSRDEIMSSYQQKQEELMALNESLAASQKKNAEEYQNDNEDEEEKGIKINKEVNAQLLSKLQLNCLKKWEKLRECQISRQYHEEKMKALINAIMSRLKT